MYYDQQENTFYFTESNMRYDLLVFYSRDSNEFAEYGESWESQQTYIYNLANLASIWLKHNFKHDKYFPITVNSWLNDGAKLIFLTDDENNPLNKADATSTIRTAQEAYQAQTASL